MAAAQIPAAAAAVGVLLPSDAASLVAAACCRCCWSPAGAHGSCCCAAQVLWMAACRIRVQARHQIDKYTDRQAGQHCTFFGCLHMQTGCAHHCMCLCPLVAGGSMALTRLGCVADACGMLCEHLHIGLSQLFVFAPPHCFFWLHIQAQDCFGGCGI